MDAVPPPPMRTGKATSRKAAAAASAAATAAADARDITLEDGRYLFAPVPQRASSVLEKECRSWFDVCAHRRRCGDLFYMMIALTENVKKKTPTRRAAMSDRSQKVGGSV